MDDADLAGELEIAEREAAIAAHRLRHLPLPSATHCRCCGREIPEARRQAVPGVELCVACKTRDERSKRTYA